MIAGWSRSVHSQGWTDAASDHFMHGCMGSVCAYQAIARTWLPRAFDRKTARRDIKDWNEVRLTRLSMSKVRCYAIALGRMALEEGKYSVKLLAAQASPFCHSLIIHNDTVLIEPCGTLSPSSKKRGASAPDRLHESSSMTPTAAFAFASLRRSSTASA